MSLGTKQLSIALEQLELAARETGMTPVELVMHWPIKPVSQRQRELKAAVLARYPEEAARFQAGT